MRAAIIGFGNMGKKHADIYSANYVQVVGTS
jgi:predicted dinucleotide-binding enzyme